MLRILKDDGLIIWFDSYGKNNKSETTRRFDENRIKQFFPECNCEFRKIIPHSQLTYRLAKHSWLALDFISKMLPFFNCMQLCIIKKNIKV